MLEKLKAIFYRPDFFREQRFTSGQAFQFYSLSILVLVIGSSLFVIPALWGVNRYFESSLWQKQATTIEAMYPDDLVLTLDQGRLLTNQTGPVVIPFPSEWEHQSKSKKQNRDRDREKWPSNLIVIDRDATLSPQAFIDRDTLVLASETEIGFHKRDRGETRIYAISEAQLDEKFEVTSAAFNYWVGRSGSLIQTGTLLLMYALPLLMYLALWIGYLIYSLLGALIVWLAAHLRGTKLTYGRAYLSTFYLFPAPFVVTLFVHIPLLFTLILFAMAILNFKKSAGVEPVKNEAKLPAPVKIAAADVTVATKTTEVEEKPAEEAPKEENRSQSEASAKDGK